ncbi:MAG TPA: thioesterase [Bacteroidetes bacterium]|jgi:hypothetical protein|nr:MAG: hypothetical protein ABR94_02050 [Sphingobacteriales bacterium BACL12 MAG-120802-bin5]HCK21221.1 thioesterase [Bacteroidota bacterium]
MESNTASPISQQQFRKKLKNPWLFRLFLLRSMPIALLAGLYVRKFDENAAVVSVPFKWLSQNPFKSVYFATQAMAAEMSTGLLAMQAIQGYHPPFSMLVTALDSTFIKKADQRVYFTCSDAAAFSEAVEAAAASGEGRTVKAVSEGKLQDGTVVSTFTITWSFKQKRRK